MRGSDFNSQNKISKFYLSHLNYWARNYGNQEAQNKLDKLEEKRRRVKEKIELIGYLKK